LDAKELPGRKRTNSVTVLCIISIIYEYSNPLWGERKLRVFENMVLRRIFGPRKDEVTGEWRRLHNEELNDLYSSPNIETVGGHL